MSYSCTDFCDTVLDALNAPIPEGFCDNPSAQADIAIAEIDRLQCVERDVTMALKRLNGELQDIYAFAEEIADIIERSTKVKADNAAEFQEAADELEEDDAA